MFSIWSEFVGAIFGRKTSIIGLVSVGLCYLLASIVITLIVSFYKVTIEQVALKESGNYLMLSEVLRIVCAQISARPKVAGVHKRPRTLFGFSAFYYIST